VESPGGDHDQPPFALIRASPFDQTSAHDFGALATFDLTRSLFRRIYQRYFRIIRGVETGDIEPAAVTASIF
jgi:hypothetical protein